MTLTGLAGAIDLALKYGQPFDLSDIYGAYYSPYYAFMSWAAMDRSGLKVELGVDQGRGLASLAVTGGTVVGVDHTRKVGLDRVMAKFSNIVYLEQDTDPPPEWFANQDEKISLLHIDTEHSYSQARAEFEAYKHMLTNPAVVIFDDLHAQEDAVLKYFMTLPYPKIIDDRMHPTCGWGVILYTDDE